MTTRVYKYGAVLKMQNALSSAEQEQLAERPAEKKERKGDFLARLTEDERALLTKPKISQEAMDELYKANKLNNGKTSPRK